MSTSARSWRRLRLALAGLAALGVAALVLGYVYEAKLRSYARTGLESLLASLLEGQIAIDQVERLTLGGIEAKGVTIFDPAGRAVLHAGHVSLGLDLRALFGATLRFSHGRAEAVRVRAYPSAKAGITLFEAFVPKDTGTSPSGPSALAIRFEHIHVLGLQLVGDVPGVSGVAAADVEARGEVIIDDDLHVRVSQVRGALTAPVLRPVTLEHATLELALSPFDMRVHARLRERSDVLRLGIRYGDVLTAPAVGGPSQLALDAELAPVSTDLLSALGVPGAEVLVPDLRGYVKLRGALDAPSFSAALSSVAGDIVATGSFGHAATHVQVHSASVALDQLVAYAPPVQMQVSISGDRVGDGPVRLSLAAPALTLYGLSFHDAAITGLYTASDRFEIGQARVRYAGGRFDVSGYVDADANLSLRVRSQVPELGRDPAMRRAGLIGGLTTDATISQRDGRLAIEGTLGLDHASYGNVAAEELRVRGAVHFDDAFLPDGTLSVAARNIAIAGEPITSLAFDAKGRTGHYRLRARADDPSTDRSLDLDVNLSTDGQSFRFVSQSFVLAIVERAPWRGTGDVTLDANEIRFDSFTLAADDQRLSLRGAYSYTHTYRLDAALERFDLGGLRELLRADLADLDGTVDGTLVLSGAPGRPRVDVQARVTDGRYLGMNDLGLALKLVYLDQRFDLDADLTLADGEKLRVYAQGTPGEGPDFASQLARGAYSFGLEFKNVPFTVATPWLAWYGIHPPAGTVSAQLSAEGALDDPRFALGIQVQHYELEPGVQLDAHADLRFDGSELAVQSFAVTDAHGPLARGSARIVASMSELRDIAKLRAALTHHEWDFFAATPERLGTSLPPMLGMPAGVALASELHAYTAGGLPVVDASLRGRYQPEGRVGCGADAVATLAADLHATEGQADAVLDLVVNGRDGGRARATAQPPLRAWLDGTTPIGRIPTQLTVHASTEALEETPYTCDYAAGPLVIDVDAQDVLATPPELSFKVQSHSLQLVPNVAQRQRLGNLRGARTVSRPIVLAIEGDFEREALSARARLESETGGYAALHVSIPRSAFAAEAPPTPNPAELRLELRSFELAPVLVAIPVASRVSGIAQGNVRALYDIHGDRLELNGSLGVSAGKLAISALGQELQDLRAQLTFAGDEVRIAPLAARDLNGRLQVDGRVQLAGTSAARLGLKLRVDDFPLRREGTQVSRLTGNMELSGDILRDHASLVLRLNDLKASVPNDLGVSVQSLDPHPAVVVKGTPPVVPPEHPYAYELRVLATNPPFRVLRSDLNAEVTTDITVRYREPALTLEGSAALSRGNFELLGKRFDLEPSSLVFDVAESLDPLVSLHASHRIGGDTIGVRVDGRLSQPKVTFTHSNPAITDTGTIVGQLLGGRAYDPGRSDRDASGAAAGVLAGATAGLLTSEVQRQFGGALPSVSMESGGTTFRGTRIRAGVQLDQLIENRLGPLRKVVRGAYVEGFVAPGATSTDSAANLPPQSRSGGLLELRFPRDLVGTVEYRPVQNWRVDLAWEP